MTARVHRTAVVEPGAALGDVVIGPFCYVASNVTLSDGSELIAHVSVLGPTRMGKDNRVFPFATLGAAPQDRSFRGEHSELVIGNRNEFREHVTVHRGTEKGGGVTRIGSDNLVMVGAHIAHDCSIGDSVVLTNQVALGGHVEVQSNVVCGGLVAVAPFVRLGRGAFIAGGAMVERDVPPFMIASGDRARVRALNRVGLRRMGVPESSRRCLKRAVSTLFRSRDPLAVRLERVERELGADGYVQELIGFLRAERSCTLERGAPDARSASAK